MNARTQAVLVAAALLLSADAHADLAPSTKQPLVIMKAARDRDMGDRMTARVRMVITGKGAKRERVFVVKTIQFGGGTRRLIVFESPANVRETGLLTYDYRDSERDDDQWLYLPALKQATRITSSRRSGSFVGSDFSFADLTLPEPEQYTHRLVKEERVDGEDCWVIASSPKSPETASETGYSGTQTWIGKRTLLPLRFKGNMASGRTKYIAATGVEVIQGIATPSMITARVVRDGKIESQTVLEQTKIRYGNDGVAESDFTVQRLERGR